MPVKEKTQMFRLIIIHKSNSQQAVVTSLSAHGLCVQDPPLQTTDHINP